MCVCLCYVCLVSTAEYISTTQLSHQDKDFLICSLVYWFPDILLYESWPSSEARVCKTQLLIDGVFVVRMFVFLTGPLKNVFALSTEYICGFWSENTGPLPYIIWLKTLNSYSLTTRNSIIQYKGVIWCFLLRETSRDLL